MKAVAHIPSSALPASVLLPYGELLTWEGTDRVVTLSVDGREAALPAPASLHAVVLGLDEIAARVPPGARSLVEGLREDVEAARSHAAPGSFASFADLETGRVVRLAVDAPMPTRVALGPRADVRAVFAALQEQRPAGLALVSATRVRLFEWAPRAVRELATLTLPELESSDLRGPSHAHPRAAAESAPGARSGRQRDLFRKRVLLARDAFLGDAATLLARHARLAGWSEIVVAGHDESAAALVGSIPSEERRHVVQGALDPWRSTAQLAGDIASILADARRRRESEILADARHASLGGEGGVVGARGAIAALAEGRVRLLLLPRTHPIVGRIAPDGTLEPAAPGAPPEAGDDLQLADLMIRAARAEGAEIALVSELGPGEAAALLRW